ncbi:hypothetical protein V1506DRAFT_540911 [Lipomyces tetrasporus]
MLLQGSNVNLGHTIEDFFPFDEEDIEDIQAVLIRLDANQVRDFLASGAFETAHMRFKDALGIRPN